MGVAAIGRRVAANGFAVSSGGGQAIGQSALSSVIAASAHAHVITQAAGHGHDGPLAGAESSDQRRFSYSPTSVAEPWRTTP